MTLHWWMHWFWVTAQIVVSLTVPTSDRSTESIAISDLSSTTMSTSTEESRIQTTTDSLARLQQSYRIAKAIGIQPPVNVADSTLESIRQSVTTDSSRRIQYTSSASPILERMRSTPNPSENKTGSEGSEIKTTQPGRIPGKKEAKITWIQAFSKPPKMKYEDKTISSSTPGIEVAPEELTVMPLQEQVEEAKPKSVDPNAIRRNQQLLVNRSTAGELLLGQEVVEPHAIATAASILEAVGLGDSTRLGRARGTFTSEFQRDQLSREEKHAGSKEEAIKETAEPGANVTEIATITGGCLAIIILLSTAGSLGFVMYRRRYLNPPQTLNSDKCSNPDSSGYIDDSTIRDNSEEMYSLDNDSFLNSLEAMTIQNYWTDSVKHTKL